MKMREFLDTVHALQAGARKETLDPRARILFLSDLHMGNGTKRDDFRRNEELVRSALSAFYLSGGWRLVLNGDVEELHKFRLDEVRAAYGELYGVFSAFHNRGALVKIVGNHDLGLLLHGDYEYPLDHSLCLEGDGGRILAFHGHQSKKLYMKYNRLSDLLVRYVASPLRIPNIDLPVESRRRYRAERRIYRASKEIGAVIIAGHTHRPLFESHSKYDTLRWNIESMLREYTEAAEGDRTGLAALLQVYVAEFKRLTKKDKRRRMSRSLYDREDILVPSMFNSGCAVGKLGFTAIEIDGPTISLVYWTRAGMARPYLDREALSREGLPGTHWQRYIIASDTLAYVFAALGLLA